MHKLTISIVSFNSDGYLLDCLDSIRKISDEAHVKVWIVDNNSNDGSIKSAKENFPDYQYVINPNNLGFSKAQNIALKKTNTEYVLILNPDSKLIPGVIKHMLEFMDKNPDVGVSSCMVEKEDGLIDWASHRGFPTPWTSFKYYILGDDTLYHLKGSDMSKPHEVDSISGAFFLTRKSVLDKVGLFDENFFMYGEDLDLCLRIKKAGYKVMFVPDVKIVHYKGVSSGLKTHSQKITTAGSETRVKAFNSFYESMKIFYKKHYEKEYPFFINWLVHLGINLKWLFAKRKMIV